MRVATWNVNGLRARLDYVLHWLASRSPDVVALQELKLTDEQFPRDAFERAGYHAVVHGQKAWNGVALLSREPARLRQQGLPGQDEFGARLLAAQVGDVCVVSLYCPNGKSVDHAEFPAKLAWFDALAEHVTQAYDPTEPLVLCGDFNLCPAPLDSWNEKALAGRIFHTDEERARFRRLIDWGLVDVFRARYPDLQKFSWWDYRGGAFHKGQGLRIDLILATEPVARGVAQVEIDRDYRKKVEGWTASDHAPVLADLA